MPPEQCWVIVPFEWRKQLTGLFGSINTRKSCPTTVLSMAFLLISDSKTWCSKCSWNSYCLLITTIDKYAKILNYICICAASGILHHKNCLISNLVSEDHITQNEGLCWDFSAPVFNFRTFKDYGNPEVHVIGIWCPCHCLIFWLHSCTKQQRMGKQLNYVST